MNKQLLVSLLSLMAVSVIAAENLLATGKWKASSYPDRLPQIIDGKMDTGWVSYTGLGATGKLECILQEPVKFQILTLFGKNLAEGVLEVSEDGISWKVLGNLTSSNNNAMLSFCLKEPLLIKGLRMNLKGASDKKASVTVSEVAGYLPDVPLPLADCEITEVGNGLNWRFPAYLLIDGNSLTKTSHWSSYKGSAFILKFKEDRKISSIGFICERPFDNVVVSVSDDGTNWTKVGEAVKLASDKMLTFPQVNTRHLKVEVKATCYSCPAELIIR